MSEQHIKEHPVFPTNPMRLYRRALISIVMVGLLILGISAIATAQSPRLFGKTTVVGNAAARGNVQLSTKFDTMKNTGSFLFNTEVHDASGKKVAQWTNTQSVTRGQKVTRAYTWNTASIPDGKYTFSIGISKPNWSGLLGWSDSAGSVVLGASDWNTSATANYNVSGTDPVSLDGRFTAPANANGTYVIDMAVLRGDKQVADWSQTTAFSGAKTVDLVRSLARPAAGEYTVQLKVSIAGTTVYTNTKAGAFSIAAPPVPTTTTTVAPTTTTVRPTPTTVEPTTTTTVPASTSTTGPDNGLTDLPGWKLEFNEQFNKDAAEGSFLSTYSNFSAYPYGWKDTSKNGTYQPNILSATGGNMIISLRTNSAGEHLVAAPEPKVNNGSTDQLYGRYSVRFKADQVAGYKTAWLLWPKSDNWNEGEIDFPEGNLNGNIEAFSHYTGAPASQSAFSSGVSFASWHVATTEWSPGKVSFFMDGKLVGTATKNIPTTAMHWVLQTETALDGSVPSNSAAGKVYIDYAAAWAYQG